jgi:SecD/SecF fusion protein
MIDVFSLNLLDSWQSLVLLAQQAPEAPVSEEELVPWQNIGIVLAVIAVLVVPFIVGGYLARAIKMPTYGTRLGAILLAVVAPALVLYYGELDKGVDIRGGTILVYELVANQRGGEEGGEQMQITAEDVIPALIERINPSGTQEIVIRPYGDSQIEIIIPELGDGEIEAVKRSITQAGILRFYIVANSVDHQNVIEAAIDRSQSDDRSVRLSREVLDATGKQIGYWADVDRQQETVDGIQPLRINVLGSTVRNPDTGEIVNLPSSLAAGQDTGLEIARYLREQGIRDLQVLMVVNDRLQVTGEDLSYAASGFDTDGAPMVRFSLKDKGSSRFLALTQNNMPDGNRTRQLGIVLDGKLLSAPSIQSAIAGEGTITGQFTQQEVDFLVKILKAGQLPAAINKTPISENRIGSTLGADTIRKGTWAIAASLVLVLIFVLTYYRFAGFVACVALALNLLLILAMMVLINQPITLPGLAGLVLTVGMSVDANVLIFERIREETKKGAAPRMAVRNGFSRATTTIVDANLTTLITAIVLYAIGTDQIRGFAVTLILGIIFSMFTAIYVSRTIFDIAERQRWLSLSMSDLVSSIRGALTGHKDLDFMSKGAIALALSAILITIGLVGLVMRGSEILDIDFAGGASVTFQLDEPMQVDDVRDLIGESLAGLDTDSPTSFTLNRVDVEDVTENTVFKVDAGLDDDEQLKELLIAGFEKTPEASLVTYHVEITPEADPNPPGPTGPEQAAPQVEETGALDAENGVRLAAAWQDESAEATKEAGADPEEAAPEEPAVAEPAGGGDGAATDEPVIVDERLISTFNLELSIDGAEGEAELNYQALTDEIRQAAEAVGVTLTETSIDAVPNIDDAEVLEDWNRESSLSFSKWTVALELPAREAEQVVQYMMEKIDEDPVWLSSNEISSRVADQMINRAVLAMVASLLFIIAYIWFRFQRVAFGLAAVVALVHDVLITLGAIAVSYWLAGGLNFLGIDQFKISLTVVAALLTIVGYSLNDTIVVFDRIRETRGKSPRLTAEMINSSINLTLSRTLLTSLTTLIVVLLLYFFGGSGIHAFAFALVVGVIVGTYSSVFVASPVLLWLVNRDPKTV